MTILDAPVPALPRGPAAPSFGRHRAFDYVGRLTVRLVNPALWVDYPSLSSPGSWGRFDVAPIYRSTADLTACCLVAADGLVLADCDNPGHHYRAFWSA